MVYYLLKRIVSILPVLLVVAIIVFGIVHLTPGDPARVILGPDATAEAVQQLRNDMGLNDPLFAQFSNWIGSALLGDLGNSIYSNAPVTNVFISFLIPTLYLSIFAQIIAFIIAIPIGVISALFQGKKIDQLLMGFSLLGISIPSFLLGLLFIMFFALTLGWFPVSGYVSPSQNFGLFLKHLTLPAFALAIMQSALIARMTRSAMLDILNNAYIKTARAKGLNETIIITKHSLKNASITILEVVGQTFTTLIAGAVVIEFVFNIPGLGQLIVNSVERRDFPIIQGSILFIATAYVFINLIIDIIYGIIDPRVRLNK